MSEKLKAFWNRHRLTRRGRLVRNLACIVLLAALCWCFADYPVLTSMQAFRRVERRTLVGPSELLGTVDLSWMDCRLIAGKGDGYYVLYATEPQQLNYWEAAGEVTLVPPPVWNWPFRMPLVLFTELPAVRAEIELTLTAEMSGAQGMKDVHYQVTVGRETGFFVLPLEYDGLDGKAAAMTTLTSRLRGESTAYEGPIPVTVRLWDGSGAMICEETRTY